MYTAVPRTRKLVRHKFARPRSLQLTPLFTNSLCLDSPPAPPHRPPILHLVVDRLPCVEARQRTKLMVNCVPRLEEETVAECYPPDLSTSSVSESSTDELRVTLNVGECSRRVVVGGRDGEKEIQASCVSAREHPANRITHQHMGIPVDRGLLAKPLSKGRAYADLTPAQATNLRTSIKGINNAGAIFVNKRIFARLQHRSPTVKHIFYKAAFVACLTTKQPSSTLNDHVYLLGHLLDNVFVHLYSPDKLASIMRAIGGRHASLKDCGFTADLWEQMGEEFVETITGLDLMANNKESCRAWRVLIATITDQLRQGYEQKCREYSQMNRHRSNAEYTRSVRGGHDQ